MKKIILSIGILLSSLFLAQAETHPGGRSKLTSVKTESHVQDATGFVTYRNEISYAGGIFQRKAWQSSKDANGIHDVFTRQYGNRYSDLPFRVEILDTLTVHDYRASVPTVPSTYDSSYYSKRSAPWWDLWIEEQDYAIVGLVQTASSWSQYELSFSVGCPPTWITTTPKTVYVMIHYYPTSATGQPVQAGGFQAAIQCTEAMSAPITLTTEMLTAIWNNAVAPAGPFQPKFSTVEIGWNEGLWVSDTPWPGKVCTLNPITGSVTFP
jgi:hypothetical protein